VTGDFSRRAHLHKVSFSLSMYRVEFASKSVSFYHYSTSFFSCGREYKLNVDRIFHSSWLNIVDDRSEFFVEGRLPLQAQYRNELVSTASFLRSLNFSRSNAKAWKPYFTLQYTRSSSSELSLCSLIQGMTLIIMTSVIVTCYIKCCRLPFYCPVCL
jgi:hypothetical protein